MARAPEPERYPYHDNSECPIGRAVKESDDWQYYAGRAGEERAHCAYCAELNAAQQKARAGSPHLAKH